MEIGATNSAHNIAYSTHNHVSYTSQRTATTHAIYMIENVTIQYNFSVYKRVRHYIVAQEVLVRLIRCYIIFLQSCEVVTIIPRYQNKLIHKKNGSFKNDLIVKPSS